MLAKSIPWNPLSIVCLRGLVAGLTLALLRRGWRVPITRVTLPPAICILVTAVLFIFATKLTTAANAAVLQYTAPVYVILFTMIFLKKKSKPLDIITVVITFGGMSLFFIDRIQFGSLLGDSLAMLCGVTLAGVFYFNSLPESRPLDSVYLGCMLSVTLLPFLFFDPQIIAGGPLPWLWLGLLGVFQLGFGYFFFSKGIQQTGALTASIIGMAEPIFNPVWVFLVLGELPGFLAVVGAVIVITMICYYNIATSARNRRIANSADAKKDSTQIDKA